MINIIQMRELFESANKRQHGLPKLILILYTLDMFLFFLHVKGGGGGVNVKSK